MKRKLSIPFERSVSTAGRVDRMEVVVRSMATVSDGANDATYPPVNERQMLLLANEQNTAIFELEPSYQPGFDRPILYRISWRREFLGRVEATDFSMPNADITYDDLFDLGAIIGDEAYLQESDLGVPDRVARLDAAGQPVDAQGNPVATSGAVTAMDAKINQEAISRQQGDAQVAATAQTNLEAQINSVISSTSTQIAAAITEFRAADSSEANTRATADTALQNSINAIISDTTAQFTAINTSLSQVNGALGTKADLVSGKIPTSQIPSIALGTAVSVPNEAAMLALTSAQVQPGDLAVRPDGTWMLVSPNPALLSSWMKLSTGGGVTSVNSQVGNVLLGASDVNARPTGVDLAQAEVTGLVSALADKLTQADKVALQNSIALKADITSVTQLRNDAVIKTAGGTVPTPLLDTDVPLVNALNQIVKKDGTVIAVGGATSVASVNGKVGTVVLVASDVNARATGTDIPEAEITNLVADLAARATVVALNSATARISQNETDIYALQQAAGGQAVAPKNVVSYVDDGTDTLSKVTVRSPFGKRASDSVLYYNHLGVDPAEAMWPYVSKDGALMLRKLVPGAPAEPDWAKASDLTALQATVATKAAQTALDALTTTVNGKADQSTVTALSNTVATKADQSALNSLTTTVGTKADQAGVDQLRTDTNASLQTKVDQAAYDTRQTSIDQQLGTKYQVPAGGIPATTLDTATQNKINRGDAAKTSVDAASTTGAANQLVRADALGQFAVLTATAAANPVRKDQMDTAVAAKADQSATTTALAAKADLVGGKVPTGQIPALATHETYAVANRAAMLALTTTQVQIGDVCIITATADQGTYTLTAADPSVFGNWLKYQTAPDAVASVNGYTGTVVLAATDVGARPAAAAIPQADVTGLTTSLTAKADKTYVDTQIATRTTPSQVTDQVATLGQAKYAADYAATANVTSLSGQQSVDGVLVALDSRVLLPLQQSSAQNGLWQVKSGAWVRTTDMAASSSLMPGAIVAVKSGSTNADSLWQMTGTAVVTVDTTAQPWAKVLRGGVPKVYTGAATGAITVDNAANTIAVKLAASASQLISDANGLRVDPTGFLRKFTYLCPAGNATPTIAHNLNTQDVWVFLRNMNTNDITLIGPTAVTLNSASIEFATAPAANEWTAIVMG